MSVTEIENALKARLATASALPKAWPNQDYFPPPIPDGAEARKAWGYIDCTVVKAATGDRTLGATSPEFRGVLIATLVVVKGTSTATANGHADAISAAFPMNLRLPAGPLTIEITQPPHVREGLTDGTYWRVPIRIPFLAH